MQVAIRIRGHLNADWADWFDGLSVHNLSNGEAVIAGQAADQAALLGILNRLHALNLHFVSVWQFGAGDAPSGPAEGRDAEET